MRTTTMRGTTILTGILAAIASIVMCLAVIPGAYATEPAQGVGQISAHQVSEDGDVVREEFRFDNGGSVRFEYNRDTGVIHAYRDGVLVTTTTDRKIMRDVERQLPPVEDTGVLRAKPGKCATAMGIAGLVNTALWGAAGIAAAPSAGASIAIGGMITGGVLTVGGMFCK